MRGSIGIVVVALAVAACTWIFFEARQAENVEYAACEARGGKPFKLYRGIACFAPDVLR